MRLYTRGWTPLRDGLVYVNDGFLRPKEVAHLLRVHHEYEASVVDGETDGAELADYRTSESAVVAQDAVVTRIMQRAAETVGVQWDRVEPPQVVRYDGPTRQYQLHHENGTLDDDGRVHPSGSASQRTHTFFCYLLPPEAGGDTYFPELGLTVHPRPAGRCVLFRNMTDAGKDDARTVHAGLPPLAGVKVGLNIWVDAG